MRRTVVAALLVLGTSLLAACTGPSHAPPASSGAPGGIPEPLPASEPATPTLPAGAVGKRAAGQENEPVVAWRALGTEPFWHVRVDGDALVFSTPEDPAGRTLHGRRVPSLAGVVYLGQDGATDFHLDIRPSECSDGMSDNRYRYEATFTYGATIYTGCGEAAK